MPTETRDAHRPFYVPRSAQLGHNERLVDKVSSESADGSFGSATFSPGKDGGETPRAGRSFADASRCFEEQLAAEEELLGEFIKSDQVARETLEHLKAMHAENQELKERVGTCDRHLENAETQVRRRRLPPPHAAHHSAPPERTE